MTPLLPGRLGNPDLTLDTDPRTDPRLVAVMAPLGMGARTPPSGLTVADPIELLHEQTDAQEEGMGLVMAALFAEMPELGGIERRTEVIRGLDGNDVTLYVHRPAGVSGPLPCILHLHGGGMTILEAAGPHYVRWRDELAATGLVVVGVEFRNAGGKLGRHPFPAGLRDCSAALQWVAANDRALGVSGIVVSGESGGGNLTLATALLAKQEGRIDLIDGVYAQCPYISNAYTDPPAELVSLHENDGYFISSESMILLAHLYDPTGDHAANPLAWPWHASLDELRGMPPHVISVNELDPLRDEGLAYYRKLLAAGVSAVGRTVNGTCHAADMIFRGALPDVYTATVRDISSFAHAVTRS